MDSTYYTGTRKEDDAIGWSRDINDAVFYPTYHQATLALLAVDRAYGEVGYYTLEVLEVPEPEVLR
jgi:hypothetical protein